MSQEVQNIEAMSKEAENMQAMSIKEKQQLQGEEEVQAKLEKKKTLQKFERLIEIDDQKKKHFHSKIQMLICFILVECVKKIKRIKRTSLSVF